MSRTATRVLGRVLVAAVAGLVLVSPAAAQSTPWRIVQGSDGSLYAISGSNRYELTPDAISDTDLAALNDAGPIGGTLPNANATLPAPDASAVSAPTPPPVAW